MQRSQRFARWIGVCVLVASLLIAFPATVVHAAVIVVDNNGDSNPANPALCIVPNQCTLRDAVAATTLAGGGTITFQPGIGIIALEPRPPSGASSGPITITTSMTIDGVGANVVVTAPPDMQLFNIGGAAQVDFKNLTMQGVNLTANDFFDLGGAVYSNSTAPLAFTNVTFLNNVTANPSFVSAGGAIYMDVPIPNSVSAPLTITNCIFIGNQANLAGGAISAQGPVTITGSTFTGNTTSGQGPPGEGGAIAAFSAPLNLTPAVVTVTDSSFTGNRNTSLQGGGNGGAIGANVLIATNVTFSNNIANSGGAVDILANPNGPTTLTNVTFTGNFASNGGGALNADGIGPFTLRNVTISGNSGGSNVPNSTVGGGGISTNSTITLANTIVAGNTFVGRPSADVTGFFISAGNNLIGVNDNSVGFTNGVNGDIVGTSGSPVDPHLGPLANNGGPTATIAPLATSPAIGAGDPGTCSGAPVSAVDQRHLPRLVTLCDIGAYQTQGIAFVLTQSPATVSAGVPFTLTVAIHDPFGDTMTRYHGTITLTSNDPAAVLPADYTFTVGTGPSFDNGTHTFTVPPGVTLKTPGTRTITATDTQAPTLTGTQTNILVAPGVPATIAVNANTTPQTTAVSTNFGIPLSVTVKDSLGNLVPNAIVTFSAPGSGASGSFIGGATTATTDANGVATMPTFTANSVAGTYQVSATVSGVATPTLFNLTNTPTGSAGIVVSVTTLPVGTVGQPYSATLNATGGTGPYTFTVTSGTVPTGLTLSSAGVFSGTPTGTTQTFTVTATDANNATGSQSYTLAIVTAKLVTIVITNTTVTLRVGDKVALKAVGVLADGTRQDLTASVLWASSDTSKATVDTSGHLTALTSGSVTVSASANGLSDSVTLTIAPLTLTGIAPPASRPSGVQGAGVPGPPPPIIAPGNGATDGKPIAPPTGR